MKRSNLICYCLTVVIISVLSTTSCKKNMPNPSSGKDSTKTQPVTPVVQGPDVYVSGCIYDGKNTIAVYWKNDILHKLGTSGVNSTATAVFVKDTDVYVAGTTPVNSVNKAVYWKNGNAVVLGNGSAIDLTIQGTDIYVTGYTDNYIYDKYTPPVQAATLWKNGTATNLTNPIAEISGGIPSSEGIALAVQGSDTYVVGYGYLSYSGAPSAPICWKNGTPTVLIGFSQSAGLLNASGQASAIWIDGTDVYISGWTTPSAGPPLAPLSNTNGGVYWKNGVIKQLTDKISSYTNALCIGVNNKDLYIAGQVNYENVYYYKNGTQYKLLNGNFPTPTRITFYNNDVYISGYSTTAYFNGNALYWKNGAGVTVSNGYSQANGIYVTAHH